MNNKLTLQELAEEAAHTIWLAQREYLACLVPEIKEGQWLTIRGHRFRVNQICGESVYLRLERCNWDTPVPMAEVLRALSSPNTGHVPTSKS